jgi:hypothetical protein
MSPRLLFLLNARNAPSWRRAGRAPRGLSDRDWMDAQAAAARMPGRPRVTKFVPRLVSSQSEPASARTALAA